MTDRSKQRTQSMPQKLVTLDATHQRVKARLEKQIFSVSKKLDLPAAETKNQNDMKTMQIGEATSDEEDQGVVKHTFINKISNDNIIQRQQRLARKNFVQIGRNSGVSVSQHETEFASFVEEHLQMEAEANLDQVQATSNLIEQIKSVKVAHVVNPKKLQKKTHNRISILMHHHLSKDFAANTTT